MEISVRHVPSFRVACVRPSGQGGAREAWERIVGWAARSGVLGRGPLIGISHDDPSRGEPHRYEACVALGSEPVDDDAVEIRETPAGLYAVGLWRGPYEQIPKMFKALLESLEKNGCALRAGNPYLEFYLNSPRDLPASDLLTEVCVPVERVVPPVEEREEGELLPEWAAEEEELEEEEEEEGEEEKPAEAPATRRAAIKPAPAPAPARKPAPTAADQEAAAPKAARRAAPKKARPAAKKAPAAKKKAAAPKKKAAPAAKKSRAKPKGKKK